MLTIRSTQTWNALHSFFPGFKMKERDEPDKKKTINGIVDQQKHKTLTIVVNARMRRPHDNAQKCVIQKTERG